MTADDMDPSGPLAGKTPRHLLYELIREIATLRDTPAGNEICLQDPLGVIVTLVTRARELLGMPPWVPPGEISDLGRLIIHSKLEAITLNAALQAAAGVARLAGERERHITSPADMANFIADRIEEQKVKE